MEKVVASIIIPTLNEAHHIKKTLKLLDKQTLPRASYELIVSDSSSTDNTVSLAKNYADKVIVCKRQSAGHGRNCGAKKAKASTLGFIDADTYAGKSWVEGLLEEIQTKNSVACTGPLETLEKDSIKINAFYWVWNIQSRVSPLLHYPIIPGFNFGAEKKAFFKVGGFPSKNMVCEDMDLSLRLSKLGRVGFNKKMKVVTSSRRQREIPIHTHIVSGIRYAFTKKSMTWNEYRKDF